MTDHDKYDQADEKRGRVKGGSYLAKQNQKRNAAEPPQKMYLYRVYRNNSEVTAEFVCEKHYKELSVPGGFMAPLQEFEQRVYTQKVTEYKGPEPCETCAKENA